MDPHLKFLKLISTKKKYLAAGPEEPQEVRDGDAGGGEEEEADGLPARPPLPPLGLCLLALERLRRPHRVGPQHSAEAASATPPEGQHQRGPPEGGREHLAGRRWRRRRRRRCRWGRSRCGSRTLSEVVERLNIYRNVEEELWFNSTYRGATQEGKSKTCKVWCPSFHCGVHNLSIGREDHQWSLPPLWSSPPFHCGLHLPIVVLTTSILVFTPFHLRS